MTDQDVEDIRRHAETMALHRGRDVPGAVPRFRVAAVPRKRSLPEPANGSTLPIMVGAVIYVRVSTKEQTENLSLPTQLRACEEYCRRQGYEVLERFHEEGESAKTTDRSQLQNLLHVLPAEQGPRALRGRVQPDALCAGQVRPLRAALAPAVAGHLAAVGDGADRRHVDRQVDGRRARRVRAVRQRLSLRPDARRHEGRAGTRTLGVPGADRLLERAAARLGKSLMPDPERAPLVRRAFEEYATGRFTKQQLLKQSRAWGLTNRRDRPLTSQAIGVLLRNQLYAGIVDVPEYGVRAKRGDFEPLISEDLFYRVQAVLSGRLPSTTPTAARAPGLPTARLRALRVVWSRPHGQLVERPQRVLRVLPLPSWLPRRQRDEGQTRRTVRRRTRPTAANAGLHAATEGIGAADLEGAEGGGAARRLAIAERAAKAIQEKLDRLDEAFLFERSIDIETYDRHAEKLREELTLARIDRHSGQLDELDVEGILAFAERVLPRAADLWVQASLERTAPVGSQ